MGGEQAKGQISSFWPYEAVITAIDESDGPKKGYLTITTGPNSKSYASEVPPLYYGGSGDSGVFQNPKIGDRVLCVRVHPGRSGAAQAIKLIPKVVGELNVAEQGDYVRAGTVDASTFSLGQDDIRIMSYGGGQLGLTGHPAASDIFLGNDTKSGLYISERETDVKITMLARQQQFISTAHRMTSGVAKRYDPNNGPSAVREAGSEVQAYISCGDGDDCGLYPGLYAEVVSQLGNKRNVPISEYRLVINEIAEHSGYSGWDLEANRRSSKTPFFKSGFNTKGLQRALNPNNALHLAPHQLVEIIGGNILSYRGEVLDSNYGVVQIGDATGIPSTDSSMALSYEKDRLTSRRAIGYHFQLSTNSTTSQTSNDTNNFVYAIDKEGVLKANIPSSSSTGNVLYPTSAEFYHKSDGVLSLPAKKSESEKIPVTLRDEENNVVYPPSAASSSVYGESSGDTSYTRATGVRHTNETGYFSNTSPVDQGGNVRVNSTQHHNMYAAAEMLIANLIFTGQIPLTTAKCGGIVLGNSIGQPFERKSAGIAADGTDKNDITFMSTVEIRPGAPAMDPGGGVIVAGQDYSLLSNLNGDSINVPYTNSFTVSQGDSGFSSSTVDSSGSVRKSVGGKSANINLEGSLELSVGRDEHDKKSIVLDTAGGLVAWFGRDANGRSMIVQTDGDVMLNVGGRTGDTFHAGRFDLRVNVTDKGYLGQENFTPDGGAHASDFIISISEAGLVIAGMMPTKPMIIRNAGNLTLESTAKLILAGNAIELREANRTPKKSGKQDCSDDPGATAAEDLPAIAENVVTQITCLTDLIKDMTD